MTTELQWRARAVIDGETREWFPARVPGNVQKDYGEAMGFGDHSYGLNAEKYRVTEDYAWDYEAEIPAEALRVPEGQRLFFVTKGIDYKYEILLDGREIVRHEGMFTPVEIDLTELLGEGRDGSVGDNSAGSGLAAVHCMRVHIEPHPKRAGAADDRTQADQCAKPPVCYGWDWHPRLLVSGIWNDTYLETRGVGYIRDCEPFWELSEDCSTARVRFAVDCDRSVEIVLCDAQGQKIAGWTQQPGTEQVVEIKAPHLWWCNEQGEPYLYQWSAKSADCEKSGTFGIQSTRLEMTEGSWLSQETFPKSRCDAPVQLVLNGRKVFAKGSNWVNPEIFTGTIRDGDYEPYVLLAKRAHMNIFRCWGGSGINKEAFYDACDRLGIMLWVEFPLACNNYVGTPEYLEVLEQEARAIIRQLRRHPSVVLWCGGNELYNNWSLMTDQSLALRLLNRLTYEMDIRRPFIATSPLVGMGHGGYTFDDPNDGRDCYQVFQSAYQTAYTEFGVPGFADLEEIRKVIPPEYIFPIGKNPVWILHHGFEAWGENRWICPETLEKYAQKPMESLEETAKTAQWLQCEGYKGIFQEARRQAPHCAMAINWCYCEPWICPANNSLLSYGGKPKAAYYAVMDSLRPRLASARIPKFSWHPGEEFAAEIWLLNDSGKPVEADIRIRLIIGDETYDLGGWHAASDGANVCGPTVKCILPQSEARRMTLQLVSNKGFLDSSYTVCMYKE